MTKITFYVLTIAIALQEMWSLVEQFFFSLSKLVEETCSFN
jgi:hypothetical protein